MFYLPHGLTIDGNLYYITDVALHQVFRFDISNSTKIPNLVLGQPFKPGSSSTLFCKPTSVAVTSLGDFFVADGYCNSRIIKYDFLGNRLNEFGKSSFSGNILYFLITSIIAKKLAVFKYCRYIVWILIDICHR